MLAWPSYSLGLNSSESIMVGVGEENTRSVAQNLPDYLRVCADKDNRSIWSFKCL